MKYTKMKYTISKEADEKIGNDLKIICEEIRKKIPDTITIILTGGFSRGEGAVKIENGKVFPSNDYDIQVISRTKVSKDKADKISVEISEKLGYKGIELFYPFKKEEQKLKENFYIDLKCDTPNELRALLPRIRTYELKNNSLILYCRDLRNLRDLRDLRHLIPDYKIKDIPLSEGAKLLLDRMSQMIEYYSNEGKYENEFLTYIIQQAYASCCTSLLLLSGKYKTGYKKSAGILKQTYKKDFPELQKKIPDLDKKIEQFTKLKLKKLPNKYVKKEWFTARKNIIEVSKYFFSRFLNKKITSLDELSEGILNMRKEFYSPYIKSIVKNKIKINIEGLSCLLLPGVSLVLKYKYYQRLKKLGINKPAVLFGKSPDLIIFSSLIFLIGSMTMEGVDAKMLKKGQSILREVYPSNGKNWEEASLDYANAYIAFFLQKI